MEDITDLGIPYRSPSGTEYAVSVEGQVRADGTWAGRLRFVSGGDVRHTEQETSQPSRDALVYWASGLEAIYLDGAFGRAR